MYRKEFVYLIIVIMVCLLRPLVCAGSGEYIIENFEKPIDGRVTVTTGRSCALSVSSEYRKYPPFDLDYIKWVEAIAKISLIHPNLTLWMLDDFDGNTDYFTLAYTQKIYQASKKINRS